MSPVPTDVDARARQAARGLRTTTRSSIDVSASLTELKRSTGQERSHAGLRLGLALVAVVAVVAGVLLSTLPAHDATPVRPVPSKVVKTIDWASCYAGTDYGPCVSLMPGAYRVPLRIPFTVTATNVWDYDGDALRTADLVLAGGWDVVVDLDPTPWPTPTSATPSGDGAALARWLAARSDVVASPVTTTTVSGRPAWEITMHLRPGATTNDKGCPDPGCNQMLRIGQPDDALRTIGLWTTPSPSRWFIVSLPGQRLALVVMTSSNDSWTAAELDSNLHRVVTSLRFDGT
jgi:hypothetical protein